MMEKKDGMNNRYSDGSQRQKHHESKPSSANSSSSKKVADPRTLFIKFSPPSASITRQHLSDHFSNYGPVNRCSVIRQTKPRHASEVEDINADNKDRGSRGFGFVRFVNEEDAKEAATIINAKRGKKGGGEVMIVDGVRYSIHAERAVDAATSNPSSMPRRKEVSLNATNNSNNTSNDSSSRVVPGVPSGQSTVVIVEDDNNNIDTKTKEDADAKYKAESKRKRTSRVIIRNLSFHATEKHIRTMMESKFGPVAQIDLPTVPNLPNTNNNNDDNRGKRPPSLPRHRGFAFVTFTNANDAKKAVAGEDVSIKNRPVAIDFSVSKMEHRRIAKEGLNTKDNGMEEEDDESDSESVVEEKDEHEENNGSDDEENDDDSDDNEDESSLEHDDDDDDENGDDEKSETKNVDDDDDAESTTTPKKFDPTESKRTLFLRNIPFDATRHDVFELFRKFGRIEAAYLVKERDTGVFRGTAFVRFETEEACASAMSASGAGGGDTDDKTQFVSGKNIAIGLGVDGPSSSSGLTLMGRPILVDLAVDRTTASSLAVRRDDDGKPIKKMVGKDKRNLYLKNEGRVSSAAESGDAKEASARHGGMWEDLPPGDRAKRERAFADKSTKLRSPLFFINPHRISIRNLAKHIDEVALKKLVFGALKSGIKDGLVTPKDAVNHWRAGGELPHAEIMRRATDPNLVTPPLDEKNIKGFITSVFIDRDVSGGKKTSEAPSRGFGFVEFTHHTHALAVLRQLNNNPSYSAEYTAGGKHASEMVKQKRGGKKGKKIKVDPETGLEFMNEDGKASVPRLMVEFAVENKVKARMQMEKVAQKKANKIKQKIENKEKLQPSSIDKKIKEKKLGRGALQREKKRTRKEAGAEGDEQAKQADAPPIKKQKSVLTKEQPKAKLIKPQKKRKVDKDDDALEDMIRSYKSSFSKGERTIPDNKDLLEETKAEPKIKSREIVTKRWFE